MHSGSEPLISKAGGWRRERGRPALAEVFGSVATRTSGSPFKRLIAFMGPGYLVAVGYMDPGNWATALAGGSKFGYALLPSRPLQPDGDPVAGAVRAAWRCQPAATWPKPAATPIRALAVGAALAAGGDRDLRHRPRRSDRHGDRAEIAVWYSARYGVLITALDVFLCCGCSISASAGSRPSSLRCCCVIALCFGIQIALASPDWGGVIRGFAADDRNRHQPRHALSRARHPRRDGDAAQSLSAFRHRADAPVRRDARRKNARRSSSRPSTSTLALMFALFINASILILAAATFHQAGHTDVADLGRRMRCCRRCSASAIAPTLFADCAAVLRPQFDGDRDAGRPDRDGRLPRYPHDALAAPADHACDRHRAGRRRDHLFGEQGTAKLLIFSQVILSLQLPFAVVPLVMFTADRAKMGELVAPRWLTRARRAGRRDHHCSQRQADWWTPVSSAESVKPPTRAQPSG